MWGRLLLLIFHTVVALRHCCLLLLLEQPLLLSSSMVELFRYNTCIIVLCCFFSTIPYCCCSSIDGNWRAIGYTAGKHEEYRYTTPRWEEEQDIEATTHIKTLDSWALEYICIYTYYAACTLCTRTPNTCNMRREFWEPSLTHNHQIHEYILICMMAGYWREPKTKAIENQMQTPFALHQYVCANEMSECESFKFCHTTPWNGYTLSILYYFVQQLLLALHCSIHIATKEKQKKNWRKIASAYGFRMSSDGCVLFFLFHVFFLSFILYTCASHTNTHTHPRARG